MPDKLKVFISYSHMDEEYKDQLLKFLNPNKNISLWDDNKISPGQEWDDEIKKVFHECHIIILLISQDFLNSDYILKNELPLAFEKHNKKEACIIPIFIRPSILDSIPEISKLEGLPKGKKWVSTSEDRDSAYVEIANGLRAAIEEFIKEKNFSIKDNMSEPENDIIKSKIEELNNKKKIFLAIAADENEKERRSIYYTLDGKKKYEGWPYEVIPNFEDSEKLKEMNREDQEAAIKKYMDESIYSIHIINTQLENMHDIVRLQYNLARRKCSGSLFKCIVGISNTNPENELYKVVEEDRNTNTNIIKLTNWNASSLTDSLYNLIEENEKKMEALKNVINPEKSVFLFYGSGDKENHLKEKLKKELIEEFKYNVRESIPDYAEAGIDARRWEEDQLKKCEGAIILYGSAAEGWFIIRKALLMDYGKIKWKAVCIDEPYKDKKYNSLKVERGLSLIDNINELHKAIMNG